MSGWFLEFHPSPSCSCKLGGLDVEACTCKAFSHFSTFLCPVTSNHISQHSIVTNFYFRSEWLKLLLTLEIERQTFLLALKSMKFNSIKSWKFCGVKFNPNSFISFFYSIYLFQSINYEYTKKNNKKWSWKFQITTSLTRCFFLSSALLMVEPLVN